MANLFEDYLAGAEALAPFYAAQPEALFTAPPQAGDWAGGMADGMRAEQARLGLAREFAGSEAVVITGQQPGLFTGPLYTIYKAITAIQCAERIQEQHGVPCVPVFWVGGEDHDFEEARTAHFLTKQHTQLSLRYAPDVEVEGLPMDRVTVEAQLHQFIDEAAGAVPGSELREAVCAGLHECLDAAESLSDWCARILARLFADTPLLFFSPGMACAREASAPVIAAAIRDPLAVTRILNERGAALADAGYGVQVEKNEGECAFFLFEDERRRKVVYEDGQFRLPETGTAYSEAELLALLEAEPTRFSPNVALRCVVQQRLFPVAAYVAGPGEIAYWAQLKPIFAQFGEDMPIVYPRARGVLTTIKTNKILRQLGLRVVDMSRPREELIGVALDHAVRSKGREIFASQGEQVEKAARELAEALGKVKGLEDCAAGYAMRNAGALDWLRDALLRADTEQVAAVEAKLERVCTTLAPGRVSQERVYNICTYLFEHGWGLAARLLRELDAEQRALQEVEL